MTHKISKSQVRDVVAQAHDKYKTLNDGANADYIPFLANIESSLFGVAVTLPDGEVVTAGDSKYCFGVESISKVYNAILVMRQSGASEILNKIGADATGLPFNSIMAMLLENDHPSTPLVNAGAISAVSMVTPLGDADGKWAKIIENMTDLSGTPLELIDELYRSESQTNYNNRSIAWLLKNYGRIYDSPDLSLDLYTKGCSMGVNVEQLSIAGATIAFGGKNPVTGKQVFESSLAPKIVSLISTVGFYERTGNWMYTSGIPSKTGVGGGVMGILPGGFGIAAFSPPLDISGNSVRAQAAVKFVAQTLKVNVFSGESIEIV